MDFRIAFASYSLKSTWITNVYWFEWMKKKKKLNDWNLQQNWKRKRRRKREKPHNKHREKNTLDFQELTRYWFSHWKRFIWFERVHTFFDLRVINVSRVVMSFSMCLIHVRKRAWYFKSANFEWNKWKNKKILSRIPQMWPLHILFPRTMCCVCVFFIVHPLRFIESSNAVYSEIYKTKTLYTKAQICRRYFRARKKKFEYTEWHTTLTVSVTNGNKNVRRKTKMQTAHGMSGARRREKNCAHAKEQCHYFKCICVFFKSKTVHLPLHNHPLVRKTLHSRRWQKRERDKKYMTKNARFSSV